ncbi:hypothetical protein B484DRAFT_428882 [Ochromonadaceae sp. CCMP2298]|nr:hypothetical protein B484DRAFT_428882 [Ochromonadaceae sp. CCMP2298]
MQAGAQEEQGARDKEQGAQDKEQGALYKGADLSHIHSLTGHLLDLSDPLVSRYLDDEPCLLAPWVQPKRMTCLTPHNTLCEICKSQYPNSLGSVMPCIYCNVIVHLHCMQR